MSHEIGGVLSFLRKFLLLTTLLIVLGLFVLSIFYVLVLCMNYNGHDSSTKYEYEGTNEANFEIENYGEREYECFGACFCSEDSRRSMSVARTSLRYIVTAVSSVVAMRISSEYFSEECVNKLSDSCSFDHIRSDISECEEEERAEQLQGLLEHYDKLQDEGMVPVSKESIVGEYVCEGVCIPSNINLDKDPLYFEMCERKVTRQVFTFDKTDIISEDISLFQEYDMTASSAATIYYAHSSLDDLCEQGSRIFGEAQDRKAYENLDEELKEMVDKNANFALCAGAIADASYPPMGFKMHEKTKCKKVS